MASVSRVRAAGAMQLLFTLVAGQLLGQDLAERGDARLGRAVVALPGVGEQARRARRVDDVARLGPAVLGLLAPVGGGPPARGEVALQVDAHDVVPLGLGHVDEHAVAQDAGVVDEDVEVAERLDRRVDEALGALPVGDVVAVGDGLAAERLDLGDDLVGRAVVGAGAVVGAAAVVDDDLGPFGGEQQGVLAAEAAPGPGDDRDAPFESIPSPRSFRSPGGNLTNRGSRVRAQPSVVGSRRVRGRRGRRRCRA